jgi:hypothetical protein
MKYRSTNFLFFIATLLSFALAGVAQAQSREDLLNQIQAKRAELQSLETQFLVPAAEDRSAYAEFLSQPDTGLVRLLPRERYDSETYRNNKATLTMRGGGAYYSFARLTHEYGYGSDLELNTGYLSVGFAGANYGMLANLGDLPLDEVTLANPAARFISEYAPPTIEANARVEYQRFANGVALDEVGYQHRLQVEPGSTYLLRSIQYANSDVLVAFKIVRQESDGSIVILWKLLKKYRIPELARAN